MILFPTKSKNRWIKADKVFCFYVNQYDYNPPSFNLYCEISDKEKTHYCLTEDFYKTEEEAKEALVKWLNKWIYNDQMNISERNE